MLVGELVLEVKLLRLDLVAVRRQLNQSAAATVARRGEDPVALDDNRCRAIGGIAAETAAGAAVAPQELAVFRPHPDQAVCQELHVLADAAGLGDDDGGISR